MYLIGLDQLPVEVVPARCPLMCFCDGFDKQNRKVAVCSHLSGREHPCHKEKLKTFCLSSTSLSSKTRVEMCSKYALFFCPQEDAEASGWNTAQVISALPSFP